MPETRVVNRRVERYNVYIGRGSKWGNPFTHLRLKGTKATFRVASREAAIAAYREWLTPELIEAAKHELRGKVLGCYCKPLPCHGDVLAEIADG